MNQRPHVEWYYGKELRPARFCRVVENEKRGNADTPDSERHVTERIAVPCFVGWLICREQSSLKQVYLPPTAVLPSAAGGPAVGRRSLTIVLPDEDHQRVREPRNLGKGSTRHWN
jgi:hypothetical protein